jgi:hypothetical protein
MKHVVALSGGKDSTAMALRLVEAEPRDYTFVCTPTGNEPRALFAHWRRLEPMLGKPLVRLRDSRGLGGWIRHYNSLPSFRQRWSWDLPQVWCYLAARGVAIPRRTDCQLCFYQRLIEWWELWRDHPKMWAVGEEFESSTGHTFRSPGRDTWPAALKDLRAEFEKGRIPAETREREGMCRPCSL